MFAISLVIGPPTLIVELIKTGKRIYNGHVWVPAYWRISENAPREARRTEEIFQDLGIVYSDQKMASDTVQSFEN